ncbi:MAG: hypothetical protein KKH28_13595 [Elusimicrobia bacterium]|nr:hypothetical protein [Elusimicrobiota bacterium]
MTGILLAGFTVMKLDGALRMREPSAGNAAFEDAFSTVLYLGLALYLPAKKKKVKGLRG